MQDLSEKKDKAVEFVKRNGPSLPHAIAGYINLSLLFTSALLSEMFREGRLKMSHTKIGGSPLYMVEGQEAMLDNFTKYLEKKEQEALELLKKHGVLEDEKLEPSHRVALRNIKDFAIMMRISHDNTEKIFWRFHTLPKEEVNEKIQEILSRKEAKELKKKLEAKETKAITSEKEVKKEGKEREEIEKEEKEEKVKKEKPKRARKKDDFSKIYDYIQTNNLSIVKEIKEDDAFAIVTSLTQVGQLNFLVIVKNKKKLSDADITLALHEGQKAKMPVLLLTPATATKKAQRYIDENKGYIIIKNIKL